MSHIKAGANEATRPRSLQFIKAVLESGFSKPALQTDPLTRKGRGSSSVYSICLVLVVHDFFSAIFLIFIF